MCIHDADYASAYRIAYCTGLNNESLFSALFSANIPDYIDNYRPLFPFDSWWPKWLMWTDVFMDAHYEDRRKLWPQIHKYDPAVYDSISALGYVAFPETLQSAIYLYWPSVLQTYTCGIHSKLHYLDPFTFFYNPFLRELFVYRTRSAHQGWTADSPSHPLREWLQSFLSTLATLETFLESCQLAFKTAASFVPALLVVSLPYWLACLRAHRIKPERRPSHHQRCTEVRRVRRCRTSARRAQQWLKIPLSTASMTFCSP